MLQLSPVERRSLRARAHGLNPVVSIAQNGLSDAVLKEIDASLKAHELIKIRVYNDDRDEREALLTTICDDLGAAPVQHIGKLLVVWRPAPDEDDAGAPARAASRSRRPAPRRTKRSFQN
ncbi:MAG TPA: YhbY family RNA-binding protein [Rhodocyclaceae bacterium]|nr:YhbY family RNA-binding protein [Rhodocyclaceae bacterium]